MSTWVFNKPVVNGSEYAGMDKFIKAERSASAAGASNFSFASTCSDYDVLYLDNDTVVATLDSNQRHPCLLALPPDLPVYSSSQR